MNYIKTLFSSRMRRQHVNNPAPVALKGEALSFPSAYGEEASSATSAPITFSLVAALGYLMCVERSEIVEQFICDYKELNLNNGVMSYKGIVTPVADYRGAQNKISSGVVGVLILRINRRRVAMVVDALLGEITAALQDIIEPADGLERYSFLEGALRRDSEIIHIINMDKLLGPVLPGR